MKEYKRITLKEFKASGGDAVYTRLQELENKIEDRTLVELPCKVGDTVYTIFRNYKDELFVSETIIEKIGFDKSGIYYISLYDELFFDIYKTRAEAEEKLKELQGK